MIALPESFLPSLLAELVTPNVIGISLGGSFARGQGTAFSDVDLELYIKEKPPELIGSLVLRMWQDFLVSIHYGTLEDEYEKLTKPWYAIWAVPGLRTAVILHDENGSIAKLKQAALEFDWAPLQPFANRFASAGICTCAEEVYKILSGLSIGNESKVIYACSGLVFNMTETVAVQRGLMIETENRYHELIQESVGFDSQWTRLFRLSIGTDVGSEDLPAYQTRGLASLGLYRETAALIDAVILAEHREVINAALENIREIT